MNQIFLFTLCFDLSEFGLNILSNLLAETIFLLLILAVGFGFYYSTSRRKISSFFGLKSEKTITIYLGRIRTVDNKAKNISGGENFLWSPLIVHDELAAAINLRDYFTSIVPRLFDQPGFLAKLSLSDIKVDIFPSEIDDNLIVKSNTIIALGGFYYNLASGYILNHVDSRVKIGQTVNFGDNTVFSDAYTGFKG